MSLLQLNNIQTEPLNERLLTNSWVSHPEFPLTLLFPNPVPFSFPISKMLVELLVVRYNTCP
ncbi:hypothetical protein M426DRAFT_233509 [Hypoxylon sp. CI-4A]|nr:hypothetical protein M426DRAFT_233509 [Hypoxylon sp. CI-4A]